jgi:DNA-binding NarL/FixJ family response regulator
MSLPPNKPDTILIVDDDCKDSEKWAKALQSCSPQYTVLTTDSVQSALDVCRCEKLACVVLDLDMNHESGFEILIDLVPDRQHPQIAIVVLTRLLSTTVHQIALEYGAHAVLVKRRTSPQVLNEAIQTAIASMAA